MVDLDDFRRYTEWHDHVNRRRYAAPADPWRLVPVDPTAVERFTVVDLRYGLGQVRGGDWDRPEACRALADTPLYEGLVQRFEAGLSWEETVYYEYVREQFDTEGGFRGLEEFEAHDPDWFESVDELYASIAEDYRTNRGAVYDDPADLEVVHELDPLALVARDGTVLWTEGFHRLTLARIAGVERVPVQVLWRHADWQATRDAVAAAGSVEAVEADVDPEHPDLQDVLG